MRVFWICFIICTQVLFLLTVCRLFPFLQGTSRGPLAVWLGPLPFRLEGESLPAVPRRAA